MDDGNYSVHDDYDDYDIMVMVMILTMMMMVFTMSNTRMIAIITIVMFHYELVRYS
jgi:hypothetical protein